MENNIQFIPVTKEYKHLEELLDIRDEAFPENERGTDRNIDMYLNIPAFSFYAIEDEGELIGFTVLLNIDKDYVFLLYLAIGQQYRNKHYGSIVIQKLFEDILNERILFGCIEALLPEASNYEQRVKRAEFYKRNNFTVLENVFTKEPSGSFQFFCSDPEVKFETLIGKMKALASSAKAEMK